jgi:hypothetical protein
MDYYFKIYTTHLRINVFGFNVKRRSIIPRITSYTEKSFSPFAFYRGLQATPKLAAAAKQLNDLCFSLSHWLSPFCHTELVEVLFI